MRAGCEFLEIAVSNLLQAMTRETYGDQSAPMHRAEAPELCDRAKQRRATFKAVEGAVLGKGQTPCSYNCHNIPQLWTTETCNWARS
jgi:hypothetical protein